MKTGYSQPLPFLSLADQTVVYNPRVLFENSLSFQMPSLAFQVLTPSWIMKSNHRPFVIMMITKLLIDLNSQIFPPVSNFLRKIKIIPVDF